MKNKTRILIADDHDIVLRGLRPLIESEWGWEVSGEARDGEQALELKPHVVVLDVLMPKIGGVELTRQSKLALPGTEVLGFTGTESEELVHPLFSAGALGCVLKSDASTQLIPAIKTVCQHKPYLGSSVSEIVFDGYLHGSGSPSHPSKSKLSPP